VGAAIQMPAVGAILPQLVPTEHLTRVNAIAGSIQSVTALVSPLVSGVMITLWPMHLLFFIDVVTAALAITVLLFFLEIPPHEKARSKQEISYFADMRLGFRYIEEHRYLISFFSFVGVLLFLISPAAFLTPLQVVRTFGSDVWRLTAIEIVFSGGMILGGGIMTVWGGFSNRMYTLIASTAVMGLCTVALGSTGIFWLYLAFMGIFGMAMPFFNTPSAVFIQEHVEGDFLGRVFSVNTMLFTSIMPLAMLLFGPIAEIVRIEWILVITGLFIIIETLVVFRNGKLIQAGAAKPAASPLQ
jgi:DHA3 family macrolide efflux protein-like MFS transporter